MKPFVIFLAILLPSLCFAGPGIETGVGDVQVRENQAYIYSETGEETGDIIDLCDGCVYSGHNQSFILVKNGSDIDIYDGRGDFTGNKASACSKCRVEGVTDIDFIVSDGERARHYDYKGNFTGKQYYLD
jgi:hypothetical protein